MNGVDKLIADARKHAALGVTYCDELVTNLADALEAQVDEIEDLKKWWGRSVRATSKRDGRIEEQDQAIREAIALIDRTDGLDVPAWKVREILEAVRDAS